MKSQLKRKDMPQRASRLNRLVFGVAFLWLVTSVLLLVLSASGSSRLGHKHKPNHDRTRKDVHHQLFAGLEHHATARPFFVYLHPRTSERI
jgi:hypothetical protein